MEKEAHSTAVISALSLFGAVNNILLEEHCNGIQRFEALRLIFCDLTNNFVGCSKGH